jgi:LmbE family N-acetylglucosaminyl deacetylase
VVADLPDLVVLSPHLDDAVLSVGALIARRVHSGQRVEVWTAFTAQPELAGLPRRWRPFGDYPVRLAEDDRALDRLGAGRRRLGLPERIWRRPRPRTLAGAFRGPAELGGFDCLPELTELVTGLLADPGVEVLAPLGVGRHADHLELAAAALLAATRDPSAGPGVIRSGIGFYEDFYALGEAFRRQHPVTRRRPGRFAGAPGWVAPALGVALRAMAAGPSGPELDRYLPAVASLPWQCTPEPVTGFEPAKLAAVTEYASQLPRLGGRRGVLAALRRAHRTRGGEPIWRLVDAVRTTPG